MVGAQDDSYFRNGMVCHSAVHTLWVALNLTEYPLRAIHASQDMITLLNLDGLYNTHVLPYADVVNDDGPNEGGGMGGNTGRKKAKMKMEKGYQHLLPDCIGMSLCSIYSVRAYLTDTDPIPAGDKRDSLALLPLMGDYDQPPTAPPELPEGPLVSLGEDAYRVARLEPGTQDGVSILSHISSSDLADEQYEKGEKKGVRDAEAKRQVRDISHSITCYLEPVSMLTYLETSRESQSSIDVGGSRRTLTTIPSSCRFRPPNTIVTRYSPAPTSALYTSSTARTSRKSRYTPRWNPRYAQSRRWASSW